MAYSAMTPKRLNPDYSQITGLIHKTAFLKFKAECTMQERQMSEVLEEIIENWLEGQTVNVDAIEVPDND